MPSTVSTLRTVPAPAPLCSPLASWELVGLSFLISQQPLTLTAAADTDPQQPGHLDVKPLLEENPHSIILPPPFSPHSLRVVVVVLWGWGPSLTHGSLGSVSA
jgi:hypothetical protein